MWRSKRTRSLMLLVAIVGIVLGGARSFLLWKIERPTHVTAFYMDENGRLRDVNEDLEERRKQYERIRPVEEFKSKVRVLLGWGE